MKKEVRVFIRRTKKNKKVTMCSYSHYRPMRISILNCEYNLKQTIFYPMTY